MTNTPNPNGNIWADGIYVGDTKGGVITDNDVKSSTGSQDWWMDGIRMGVSSSSNIVSCNRTHDIGRGLYFDGTQIPGTGVAKNVMKNNDAGLLLNSSVIGQQGFGGTPFDNEWRGSFITGSTEAWFSDFTYSPFYVQSTFPYYPFVNFQFNGVALAPITTPGTFPPNNTCPVFNVPVANFITSDQAHKIIRNEITYPYYNGAMRWMSKYNLYALLRTDTTLLNSDTIFVHFKDSCDQSNLGKLRYITWTAADPVATPSAVAAATTVCNNLCPVSIIEGHYKTINTILLQHKGTNIPFSTAEINTIRGIAQLCPLTDGPGVMYARAIMPQFDGDVIDYSNSCEQVPQGSGQRLMAPQQDNEYSFKLYPNPNNGLMQMDYALDQQQTGELTIYGITGNKIASYTLQTGDNTIKIDQQHLQAGVYIYKVVVNGKTVQQDKIVIIK